jgi:phosphatidylglycerol:prolipoprotein diacylglycerol transferase
LSGCCFGGACDLPWAVTFPFGSAPHVHQIRSGQTDLHGLWLDFSQPEPRVARVEPGSAAAAAGLAAGDRLRAIDGQPVETAEQALAILLEPRAAGQTLSLSIEGKSSASWRLAGPPARSRPVHPAQLYSALDALILCGFLLAYYPYRRRDGQVIALGLMLHAVSRYLLEVIRIDEPAVFGTGLSISQTISIGIFAAVLVAWIWLFSRPQGSALPASA